MEATLQTRTRVAHGGLWRTAQVAGVALTLVLIGALLAAPAIALRALWDVAIPLLPAVFLIQPALWRNVCPLATLNTLPTRFGRRHVLGSRLIPLAGTIGILLLWAMVPARRFLFNANGPALAMVIIAIALLAIALGLLFEKKAGFCNAICPVLPVERLYGQDPLFAAGNAHCQPCTACTASGCVDLAQVKSIAQVLGRARRSHRWLTSSFGVFAAAFPGFVIGYNLTQDGAASSAPVVYLTVMMWMVASYAATSLIVRAFDAEAAGAMRVLGAIAIAFYYWFAGPVVAGHLHLPAWAPVMIRACALSFVAFWFFRNVRHQNLL